MQEPPIAEIKEDLLSAEEVLASYKKKTEQARKLVTPAKGKGKK